jgi:hypothetical protein
LKSIEEIVNARVATMVSDGSIEESINKGVEKAIGSAIKSQFESYGNITEQIKKSIDGGLKVNTSVIPFESYNKQMMVLIKERLGNMFKGLAAEKFMEEVEKILDPAPKEIKIEDFVETIAKFWKTDEPWDADDLDDYATVEIETNDYGGISLNMWKQKESSGYSSRSNSADLQLYINKGELRINHSHSFNPTCFSEHEAYVFKLYAAGTIITGIEGFDPDECELTLKEESY